MRTSFIALVGLVASTLAAPASFQSRQASICPNPEGNPVCCNPNADVAGAVDLGCTPPSTIPASVNDFKSICDATANTARCCDIVIFDIGIGCSSP